MPTKSFSHLNDQGEITFVDVSDKQQTHRTAIAQSMVLMESDTLLAILNNNIKKGNVITCAKIAGVMGGKKTSDLIPMCHPIPLDSNEITIEHDLKQNRLIIQSTCKSFGKTGVEMEALTSVSIAALTIYDMCKSHDRSIKILETKLLYKSGGKSGVWNSKNNQTEKPS